MRGLFAFFTLGLLIVYSPAWGKTPNQYIDDGWKITDQEFMHFDDPDCPLCLKLTLSKNGKAIYCAVPAKGWPVNECRKNVSGTPRKEVTAQECMPLFYCLDEADGNTGARLGCIRKYSAVSDDCHCTTSPCVARPRN